MVSRGLSITELKVEVITGLAMAVDFVGRCAYLIQSFFISVITDLIYGIELKAAPATISMTPFERHQWSADGHHA